jgi:hypothetical protein
MIEAYCVPLMGATSPGVPCIYYPVS